MRRLVVALVATSALSFAAQAADMPVKAPAPVDVAPYNWTGFYIGGHIGALWSSGDSRWDPLPTAAAFGDNQL
jgi:opacity protein-like surface antigen